MVASELKKGDVFKTKNGRTFREIKYIDAVNDASNADKSLWGKVYIMHGKCKELILDSDCEVILKPAE